MYVQSKLLENLNWKLNIWNCTPMINLTANYVNYRSEHLFHFFFSMSDSPEEMVRGGSHQSEIGTEQIQWTGHRSGECRKVNITSVFIFFLSFFPSFFSFHEYAWLMQMTTIFDWRDLNVSRLSNRLRSKKQVQSHHCQSTVSLLSVYCQSVSSNFCTVPYCMTKASLY